MQLNLLSIPYPNINLHRLVHSELYFFWSVLCMSMNSKVRLLWIFRVQSAISTRDLERERVKIYRHLYISNTPLTFFLLFLSYPSYHLQYNIYTKWWIVFGACPPNFTLPIITSTSYKLIFLRPTLREFLPKFLLKKLNFACSYLRSIMKTRRYKPRECFLHFVYSHS